LGVGYVLHVAIIVLPHTVKQKKITYVLSKLQDDGNNAEDQMFENIFVRMVLTGCS